MDNVRFAKTIKNARLKKGYTQSQLADLLMSVIKQSVNGKQEEVIRILLYLLR